MDAAFRDLLDRVMREYPAASSGDFAQAKASRSRPARSRQKGCSFVPLLRRERKQQSLKEETWQ
jgi:hypothetical protein